VAKSSEASLIGNVYLGKVQNVLPSMEAAFVDIGRGRNAVLYSGEVDWELAETGNQQRRIELALKSGDTVLVQVTKDPVGQKGARLTSAVSLPGRYLVYVPNGSMNGISRKLPETERTRLKRILKEVLPEDAGVIVRTAAEGATEEQLTLDVQRLQKQWADIQKKVAKSQAPLLLHSEPDLLIKIIRDVFNEDFQKLVISGDDAREAIEGYLAAVAPDLQERVENYTGKNDIFDEYRIGEQIYKALERKVYLPSGGSLVIDRTEAMTVVDVNTGKFVGSGGNLEETVTKNNLEAAEEVVRQLRLRDIGGIIVIDFIDMVLENNRDLVQRRLMECLSRDRTKHQVAEVTSLGLVQMTRKKLGIGLLETFSEACDMCAGRGVIVHHEPHMRSGNRSSDQGTKEQTGGNSSGGRGKKNRNQPPKQEVAKVVTAESASQINNLVAQIAASTLGDRDVAGSLEDKSLDAVMDALPEPTAPNQGRKKAKRVTSGGIVTPQSDSPSAKTK
jgi:ribonuclease E